MTRKHIVAVTTSYYSHSRGLTCLLAHLIKRAPDLYVTSFVPVEHEKPTAALLQEFHLDDDAAARLRIVYVIDPRAIFPPGTAHVFVEQYYDALMAGQAIDEHAALPAPDAVLVDVFAYPAADHARESGFKGEIMQWMSSLPGSVATVQGLTARLLESEEPFLFDQPGLAPRWTYELSCSTNPLMQEVGAVFELMKGVHRSRMSGHRPVIGFSRVLLPESIGLLDHYVSWAQKRLITTTMYPDSFWSTAPPTFPVGDPLFDWLGKQKDNSVVFITFGSMSFPKSMPWQLEVLLDSLIASSWRFVMLISSKEASDIDADFLGKITQRIEASGNFHTAWTNNQPLALRHPAVGVCLHHGGAGGMVEAVVAGKPAIVWPFWADQSVNASVVADTLDAGWQLYEHRDRLVGKKIASKPDLQVKGTPASLRIEVDEVLVAAAGLEGQRKRANAAEVGDVLRQEWLEHGGQYLEELIALF